MLLHPAFVGLLLCSQVPEFAPPSGPLRAPRLLNEDAAPAQLVPGAGPPSAGPGLGAPNFGPRDAAPQEVNPADASLRIRGDAVPNIQPLAPPPGGVIPTNQTAPADPGQEASGALLEVSLATPRRNAMAGKSLTLLEAVARAPDPARRQAVVKHYWFATYLLGEYHFALEELDKLTEMGRPQQQYDQIQYEAARASALARAHEAELNVVVAQYELAELAGLPVVDALPLPSDRPLVGVYGTKFDSLFAGRTPPSQLRRIDRTLPLRQKLIISRTSSVATAQEVFQTDLEAYRGGQVRMASVIESQAKLREARSAFLLAVRQYNFDIAEYATSLSVPGMNAETLVGMLIGGGARSPMRSVLVPNGGSGIATASLNGGGGGAVVPTANFQTLPAGGRPLQELSTLPAVQPTPAEEVRSR